MPTRTPTTSTSSKEEATKKRTTTPLATQKTLTPTSSLSTIELQQMAADPRTARPSEVLAIQRQFGNQAVTRLIQAKLTVGAAHDAYEQEADRVAAQVVSAPDHASTVQRLVEDEEEIQAKPLATTITPLVQRLAEDEEELQAKFIQREGVSEDEELQAKFIQRASAPEEDEIQAKPLAATITPLVQRAAEDEEELQAKFIQREGVPEDEELQAKFIQRASAPEEDELQTKSVAEGGAFSPAADFESRLNAGRGGGTPLPDSVREFMEPRFGADFSGVRLHTGAESAKLNRAVSAQAFTQGQDIYLGEGHTDVQSGTERQLLAHELTHVVQQGGVDVNLYEQHPLGDQAEREAPVVANSIRRQRDLTPTPGQVVVQRLIAKGDAPRMVYIPNTLNISGEFRASLGVLLGNHQISQVTWDDFKRHIVWPDADWSIPAEALRNWAAANLGTGRNQEAHTPAPEHTSQKVDAEIMNAVKDQFLDEMSVHKYSRGDLIQYGENDQGKALLLRPQDMREAGGALPGVMNAPEACVIQALEDFQVNVPGTAQHSAAQWHQYSRAHHLDYRTNSQYIKLYVQLLHYSLVNNQVMAWNAVDWNALGGDGRYLVSTYPNGAPQGGQVGHMVGVVITHGAVTTIHDQQQLTAPHVGAGHVHIRYVFRM